MKTQEKLSHNPLETKTDYVEALITIIDPVYQLMEDQETPGRFTISATGSVYDEGRRAIEGFLRTLWGLGPLFSSSQAIDKYRHYFDRANEGIVAGTDPHSPFYWGDLHDYDQLFVEMGALATYLNLTRENFWETLGVSEQNNIYSWLNQINQHTIPSTNWLFFRILVNSFFETVHLADQKVQLERDLDAIDTYYLGDGWYFDGYENQIDYYVPFAMQYYGLLFTQLCPGKVTHKNRFTQRGAVFAQTFKYWFSQEGTALPFGRSLTYRFAQSAYFAAAAYAKINFENFSLAEAKYLLRHNMRHWFQQPIFTPEGFLTVGYSYPNLVPAEGYNAPGSPYWALKNFIVLALPDDDAFWHVEEQTTTFDLVSKNERTRMLMVHDPSGRELQAFTAGQHSHEHAHGEAKYEKYVYSTTFGFSVAKNSVLAKQGGFDNTLAIAEGPTHYKTAFGYQDYAIHQDYVYSLWRPYSDTEIQNFIIPCYPWHVRIHKISTQRQLTLFEGGFSAPAGGHAQVNADQSATYYESSAGKTGVVSFSKSVKTKVSRPEPNTNLLFPETELVCLSGDIAPGESVLISAYLGTPDIDYLIPKTLEVSLTGKEVVINVEGKRVVVEIEEMQ